MAKEQRDISGFTEVILRDIGTLTITQGDNEALTVEAADDIISKIKTEVRDNRLLLSVDDSVTNSEIKPIEFDLSARNLDAIELAGSGDISTSRLKANALKVALIGSGSIRIGDLSSASLYTSIPGSGSVTIAGTIPAASVDMSGSGSFNGTGLDCREAKVTISGAGSVVLQVSEKLDVDISGSGAVRYMGNPTMTKSITGSGYVSKIGDK